MINEVIIASKNQGKIEEFSIMLEGLGIKVRSINDISMVPDIIEDGVTFEENARKKAVEISKIIDLPVIADDSGLLVDALNGEPGIFSARYAGEEKNDKKNNDKLLYSLKEIADIYKRTARFVCTIALAIPNKKTIIANGICEGLICFKPKGSNGFGYDPIFYIPEYNKTMAEIDMEQKNKISHRSKALEELMHILSQEKIFD